MSAIGGVGRGFGRGWVAWGFASGAPGPREGLGWGSCRQYLWVVAWGRSGARLGLCGGECGAGHAGPSIGFRVAAAGSVRRGVDVCVGVGGGGGGGVVWGAGYRSVCCSGAGGCAARQGLTLPVSALCGSVARRNGGHSLGRAHGWEGMGGRQGCRPVEEKCVWLRFSEAGLAGPARAGPFASRGGSFSCRVAQARRARAPWAPWALDAKALWRPCVSVVAT